jgi:UDP-N-acetylglucosamine:LPS N-acetylglucosamine transferase
MREAGGRRRILAVASGGGHWVQLRRIRLAFAGLEVVYVGTDPAADVDLDARYYEIRNVTRRNRLGFVVVAWQVLRILIRERPDVVVTTGAAPGFVALAAAKIFLRSRTIWIDSISSSENLTLSARLARPVADVRLVQWKHLARPEGPEYWGAVL